MTPRLGRPALLLMAAVVVAPAAAAQTTVPVDRIVAVVGSRPFLASEIEEQLITLRSQGQTVPTDSAALRAFRRQLLGQMIDQELLVQEAQRDTSIKVTEQEVQDQVEQSVQNIKKQIPDPAEFQRQLKLSGFTSVDEWRRKLTEEQRRSILSSRLLDELKNKGKIHNIPPTEAQMREFWTQYKGQQPKRPAVASFRQIVVVRRTPPRSSPPTSGPNPCWSRCGAARISARWPASSRETAPPPRRGASWAGSGAA